MLQGHSSGDYKGRPLPLETRILIGQQPLPVSNLLPGGAAVHPALPAPTETDPPEDRPTGQLLLRGMVGGGIGVAWSPHYFID